MLFYFMHRYLHENKWLLRNVHAVHHQPRNPCSLEGNHHHWLEYALTAQLMLIGPLI